MTLREATDISTTTTEQHPTTPHHQQARHRRDNRDKQEHGPAPRADHHHDPTNGTDIQDRAKRSSTPAHRGITIPRFGPASGRPTGRSAPDPQRSEGADLACRCVSAFKQGEAATLWGWSGC